MQRAAGDAEVIVCALDRHVRRRQDHEDALLVFREFTGRDLVGDDVVEIDLGENRSARILISGGTAIDHIARGLTRGVGIAGVDLEVLRCADGVDEVVHDGDRAQLVPDVARVQSPAAVPDEIDVRGARDFTPWY